MKAVSEIFAPARGEVTKQSRVDDTPEKINTDPHGAGWLIKIKLANPAELDGLMDAAAYEAYAVESKEASPDAVSAEKSRREAGNAGGHRREIRRRTVLHIPSAID